ncbi:TetR/AcrR family transcriptional regulator [Streptomyces sp. NRRL WC-3742]|uniref:TetR/AcrR family transcriptional regulator n=1 Tax=Streptomyces sp. NRRL WC-3742 TaxID=1463934 RepID=UPI0004CB764C|nr:TetR/AcrR family transcriptional regulator [Streptomyces sp. NRRL WC-3742]
MQKTAPTPSQGVVSRTGPRRSESIRLAVINAADDLLVERGFTALTIESIAGRAGVAKQTIYRWWKSKVDILVEALDDDARDALRWEPGTGDARQDLEAHLLRVAAFLEEPAGRVLHALLSHAQLDAEEAERFGQGFLAAQRERDVEGLREILYCDLGHRVDRVTAERFLDVLFGPLHYRRLTFRESADVELVRATVRLVHELAVESARP